MPHIDKFLGRFSDYQRVRSEKRKAEIDREVQRMFDDKDYFLYKLSQKNDNLLGLSVSIGFFVVLSFFPTQKVDFQTYLDSVKLASKDFKYVQVLLQVYFNPTLLQDSLVFGFLLWNIVQFLMLLFVTSQLLRFRRSVIILKEYFKRKTSSTGIQT